MDIKQQKKKGVQRRNGHTPNKNSRKDKLLKFVPKDTPPHKVEKVLTECKQRNYGPIECAHCNRVMDNVYEEHEYRCNRCSGSNEISGYVCKNCYCECPNPKLMAYGLQHMLFGRIIYN